MQMAMAVGGCTGEDADLLRRAMGSKRGLERIDSLHEKLYAGMASNGLTGEIADDIYGKIQAFANFGFAESHALSFALLVYASSWIKLHYPAAFLAGLLRAQPMGFYSPATLIGDARRHGVEVRRPDILLSGVRRPSRSRRGAGSEPTGLDSCTDRLSRSSSRFDRTAPDVDGRPPQRRRLRRAARPRRRHPHRHQGRRAHRRRAGARRRLPLDMEDLVRRAGLTTRSSSSRSRPRAPSTASSSPAARRSGAPARPPRTARSSSPDSIVAVQPPLFADPTSFETLAVRPLGDRRLDRRPPARPLPARRSTSAASLSSRGLRTAETGRRDRGRGAGDAPAAAGHGIRHHLPQPRGRDTVWST